MRWLARLLHARRKKPRRPDARVFHAHSIPTPVTYVLNKTADVITGTLKERGRQHRESLPARRAPPPLPPPQSTANKDVSPITPQLPPEPTSRRQQSQPTPAPISGARSRDASLLADLKLASTTKQRQAAALKHPELRPPHTALTSTEDLVLELACWQGLTYKEIGARLRISSSRASQICHRALRKLSYHLARGGRPGEVTPSVFRLDSDARLDDFRAARSVPKRLAVAARYPELRPPHECLSERENDLLELVFWQAQTFSEIANLKNTTRKEVGTGIRWALERLNAHLCGASRQDEDHLDEVLLALNECGSVRKAAKKLEVGKDVLKAFVEQAGVKARIVFEVER